MRDGLADVQEEASRTSECTRAGYLIERELQLSTLCMDEGQPRQRGDLRRLLSGRWKAVQSVDLHTLLGLSEVDSATL